MSSATNVDTPAPRRRIDVVAYLKLFRFPLVFTAIADSAAGYLISTRRGEELSPTLGLLACASGGLYLFGMALNDIADREKDRVGAPGKVIPSGRVSLPGAILASGLVLVASFFSILLIQSPAPVTRVGIWGCVLLCICAYDLHWVKFPPVMGLVRSFNLLLGIASAREVTFEGSGSEALVWKCVVTVIPIFLYVTSLTYISTLEDGEIDRRKLAVGSIGMSLGALLAATLIPAVKSGMSAGMLELLPALGVAWTLVAWILRRAWKARDRKGVMLVVRDGVAGIILVDAAVVLSLNHLPQGLMVAALLIPAVLSLALFKKLA